MKKIIIVLSFLLPAFGLNAQRLMEKDFQVIRVPLKEKFNLSARNFPPLLIQAFCEGSIIGYYPQKPTEECGYHEFAAHFQVKKAQPTGSGDAFEEVFCPASFCSTKDEASVEPFRFYFDVVEDKVFNKETSTGKNAIKYIRLVCAYEKHGMETTFPGAIFKYEDVIKLEGKEYSLFNPKNNAARISLKQYFEGRMFTGFPLNATNTRPKEVNPNKEKDKWEN